MATSRHIRARCPRCRGHLLHYQDRYGAYLNCLSCGYVLEELPAPPQPARQPTAVWWSAQSG